MDNDKKDDTLIYTETPATGINNGVEITPTPKQEEKIEEEASEKLEEQKQEDKKDQKEKTDTSGEAG